MDVMDRSEGALHSWRAFVAFVLAGVFVALLVFSLFGCDSGDQAQNGQGDQDSQKTAFAFAWEDVDQALSQALGKSFGCVTVVDAQADPAEQTIYLTFESTSSDAPSAIDSAEEALRQVSVEAAYAALARVEGDDAGADEIAQAQELTENGSERAAGLGVLYENWSLSLLITDQEGALRVDGLRAADSSAQINWQ